MGWAKASRPVPGLSQGLLARPWPGQSQAQNVGSGRNHQKWAESGPESTVWLETWSKSMPGPFRSLWDGSNPLQGAVPGLVLEVQVGSTMSVRAQSIKNGPNWVQNRPFGLKLGPEACQDRSGAFGMGLTHSKGPSRAKKVKKYAQKPPGQRSANCRQQLGLELAQLKLGLTWALAEKNE